MSCKNMDIPDRIQKETTTLLFTTLLIPLMERKSQYTHSSSSISSSDLLLPRISANVRHFHPSINSRRRFLFLSLAFTSLVTLCSFTLWTVNSSVSRVDHLRSNEPLVNLSLLSPELHPLDPLASLKGPPTMHFKGEHFLVVSLPSLNKLPSDNLRPELKYISSWISAGWSQ